MCSLFTNVERCRTDEQQLGNRLGREKPHRQLPETEPEALRWEAAVSTALFVAFSGPHICIYVRVCVCMHAWIYACMHVFIYVCMYVCKYVCKYVCMYVCMYVMYVCMYVMYACMHIFIYVCM
jgi:hypothetical protein